MTTPIKSITAEPHHHVAYQEIVTLVTRNADKMTAEEMLAVAANLVGKLIAMCDQRTMTAERAYDIVRENIECGNQEAIESFIAMPGGRA